jgi:hypothetical protein
MVIESTCCGVRSGVRGYNFENMDMKFYYEVGDPVKKVQQLTFNSVQAHDKYSMWFSDVSKYVLQWSVSLEDIECVNGNTKMSV